MSDSEEIVRDSGGYWRYAVMFLPYSLPQGFLTVALAYVLSKAHVPTVAIAGAIALQLAPQTWKVLWAPVVDCVWSYKRWYWVAGLVNALLLAALGFVPLTPAGLPALSILALLGGVASTFLGMATTGLMAHAVPMERKGRAAGWSQAGNIGSIGLGGGFGLWMTQHAGGVQVAAVALGVFCLLCIIPVLSMDEPVHDHRAPRLSETLKKVLLDLWGLARSKLGLLALGLVLLPMGTGAAANLFASVAGDWKTDADTVALITGFLAAIASAIGALVVGFVADRFDRKTVYIGSAICMAACTAALAILPRTPLNFVILTTLYAVSNGFMYAAYYAVAFEAIGKGAAATKAQLLGCATNLPAAVATLVEGAVQTKSGSVAMLWAETGMTVVSIAVFGLFAWLVIRLWPRPKVTLAAV
jgi:PAT family beta-lactamase induction signal transducer AmpG